MLNVLMPNTSSKHWHHVARLMNSVKLQLVFQTPCLHLEKCILIGDHSVNKLWLQIFMIQLTNAYSALDDVKMLQTLRASFISDTVLLKHQLHQPLGATLHCVLESEERSFTNSPTTDLFEEVYGWEGVCLWSDSRARAIDIFERWIRCYFKCSNREIWG